jgi:hypothetical protein
LLEEGGVLVACGRNAGARHGTPRFNRTIG